MNWLDEYEALDEQQRAAADEFMGAVIKAIRAPGGAAVLLSDPDGTRYAEMLHEGDELVVEHLLLAGAAMAEQFMQTDMTRPH